MGAKYQTNSASGYNSSPPADDGSQTASNLITWSGQKTKLADPIKTLADDINTDLVAAFDYAVRRITASDSTVAGDHMRTVEIAPNVSTAVTVSLGDAATMTNIYRVYIKNSSTVNQTVGRVTSGDQIDRIAQDITIPAGACFEFTTTNAADGYLLTGAYDESEPDVVNGRITLTSGTPVTTADVTSATTIYFTPYKGNKVTLFDGVRWRRYTFTEVSLAVPTTSSTVYDLFLYDNAGTLTLDATAWTNDTTRATALTTQNGVYVKTGAVTRRYLGTFRTTAGINGQTEDSATRRYVWNYYNRIKRLMRVIEATDSWNYTTASFRQVNNSTANQLDFVIGVVEDLVYAEAIAAAGNSGNVQVATGIGSDSTTTIPTGCINGVTVTPGSNFQVTLRATYESFMAVGRHTLVWLEYSGATNTTTWYGDNGSPSITQSGIHGWINA
jgi:hypothetical protein